MSRTEAETVAALDMYVTRYFDSIELSDAKDLVKGFKEFLAQNPHTGQIIREQNPVTAEAHLAYTRRNDALDQRDRDAAARGCPRGSCSRLIRRILLRPKNLAFSARKP